LFGENIGFFTGQDIKVLSSKLSSCGQKDDPNATPWVTPAKFDGAGKIDGYWGSRWSGGNLGRSWVTGNARVETSKEYVYIVHRDIRTDCFLACHRIEENILLGRWLNIFHPEESTPYVAKIVSNSRIDGFWLEGRWDLQRVDK
jgi:hypothetical protein